MKNVHGMKLMSGLLVLAGALLTNTAPLLAQNDGYAGGYNDAPAGQLDSLVSRIALYPDALLAQIFAAAAFPDQITAASQGAGGPFDPSVEALTQYPDVLQIMASDPNWTQALGQAVIQDQSGVMDAIQNLRREAQQYGYLQSGPQMQVVDDGGYIEIQPVTGYMYVPIYDPYVVFARPHPGFFVGGAIRFGGGFHWVGGYDRFNWRSHEVVVNRRVWTPPVHRLNEQPQRSVEQRRFDTPEQPRRDFGRQLDQRKYTAPQPEQRSFTREQSRNAGGQMEQRNFIAPQRSFTANPRPMEQRSLTSQPRNQGERFERGGEGHGRGR